MTDRDIHAWLETGRAILSESCGMQLGQVRIIVGYKMNGEGIEWTLPPSDRPFGRPAATWTTLVEQPPGITSTVPRVTVAERETLRVIGGDTLPMKQVARRLNTTHRSALKVRLARLRRDGLLGHQGRGYFITPLGRRALAQPQVPIAAETPADGNAGACGGQVAAGGCTELQSSRGGEDGIEVRDHDHEQHERPRRQE